MARQFRPTEFQRTGIVTLRGPLFEKNITKVIERQIVEQAMARFEERVRRPKKGGHNLGRKRNPIGPGDLHLGGGVVMTLTSTIAGKGASFDPSKFPRTTGYSWTESNVAAIKKMAPNVLRKLAKKIVGELGG